jgi:hypothetical protein
MLSRSQEFPYLTITEAVDNLAGVQFTARHCFMLESISISVKPRVHVRGPKQVAGTPASGRWVGGTWLSGEKAGRGIGDEAWVIALKDDMWQQLLGKGKICGDERWLIGENAAQEVVVLHFDWDGRQVRG